MRRPLVLDQDLSSVYWTRGTWTSRLIIIILSLQVCYHHVRADCTSPNPTPPPQLDYKPLYPSSNAPCVPSPKSSARPKKSTTTTLAPAPEDTCPFYKQHSFGAPCVSTDIFLYAKGANGTPRRNGSGYKLSFASETRGCGLPNPIPRAPATSRHANVAALGASFRPNVHTIGRFSLTDENSTS